MTNLKTCPTNVENTWEKRIVKILILNFLTPKRSKDRDETNRYNDQSENVPWSPLAFIKKNIPYLVSHLSERHPTIGVTIPSVICPARIAMGAADVLTTVCKKKRR